MIELICLFDSKKLLELDIKQEPLKTKVLLDFNRIECFRVGHDEDGNEDGTTYIEMYSGSTHCVDMSFEEFQKLFESKRLKK